MPITQVMPTTRHRNRPLPERDQCRLDFGAFDNSPVKFSGPKNLGGVGTRTQSWLSAESYLPENDYLIFVTANPKVFAPLYEALREVR